MKIFPKKDQVVYVWTGQPAFRIPHRKKPDPNVKETPEEMIRSLQDVLCKGRYRSWTNFQAEKAV